MLKIDKIKNMLKNFKEFINESLISTGKKEVEEFLKSLGFVEKIVRTTPGYQKSFSGGDYIGGYVNNEMGWSIDSNHNYYIKLDSFYRIGDIPNESRYNYTQFFVMDINHNIIYSFKTPKTYSLKTTASFKKSLEKYALNIKNNKK